MIVTLPEIKDYLSITHAREDSRLKVIGEGLTALFEEKTGLAFIEQDYDEVHNFNPCIPLRRHPIAQVTKVFYDTTRAWKPASELDPADWSVNLEAGLLYMPGLKNKPPSPQSVRVLYHAGYTAKNIPDLWPRLFLAQVQHEWQNRDKMGVKSVTDSVGGSVSMVGYELLPNVSEMLRQYRRVLL